MAELQRLTKSEWPAVRDSLAVNETKAFAAKLDALGARWNSPPVRDYAQMLARQADSYAVVEMEKQLHEFSALVERLEKSLPA